MPLYRRMELNMQLLEFRCQESRRGVHVRPSAKEAAGDPLGKRHDGDRRHPESPEGDAFYEWYAR